MLPSSSEDVDPLLVHVCVWGGVSFCYAATACLQSQEHLTPKGHSDSLEGTRPQDPAQFSWLLHIKLLFEASLGPMIVLMAVCQLMKLKLCSES